MINFKVELRNLLSCMDAVFKLLHVEIARKATDGSEKKIKKNKILFLKKKSNKIRQNFRKNKIFKKNEIFVENNILNA